MSEKLPEVHISSNDKTILAKRSFGIGPMRVSESRDEFGRSWAYNVDAEGKPYELKPIHESTLRDEVQNSLAEELASDRADNKEVRTESEALAASKHEFDAQCLDIVSAYEQRRDGSIRNVVDVIDLMQQSGRNESQGTQDLLNDITRFTKQIHDGELTQSAITTSIRGFIEQADGINRKMNDKVGNADHLVQDILGLIREAEAAGGELFDKSRSYRDFLVGAGEPESTVIEFDPKVKRVIDVSMAALHDASREISGLPQTAEDQQRQIRKVLGALEEAQQLAYQGRLPIDELRYIKQSVGRIDAERESIQHTLSSVASKLSSLVAN